MKLKDEFATALFILCQAFLSVFASKDDKTLMGSPDPIHKMAEDSLKLMEWKTFYVDLVSTGDLQEKWNNVTRRSWWANVFEGKDVEEEDIENVIGPRTRRLVKEIFKEAMPRNSKVSKEITVDLVAPAFLEIRNFLGQTENQELILQQKPSLIVTPYWRDFAYHIVQNSEMLFQLDWKRFEDLVAHILEESGWSIEPMGYTKDGGIDIIAARKIEPGIDFRMMVQCKRFAKDRKVGVEIVRELWSVKWEHAFHQAMLATTSSFTKGAIEKAEVWNLELKDHQGIIDWCKQYSGKVG